MPGDEPQTDVQIVPVMLGDPITANTVTDRVVLTCPDNEGAQLEFKSLSFACTTVPADADGVVTADIEFVDDSAADAKANLNASAVDLESLTAIVNNEAWRGSQLMDPGDAINIEFTNDSAAIDTAVVGLVAILEFRVLKRSAG